jgi:GDP-L-fucose synthase
VNKLLFLGSSCIYPEICHQPMHESELLQGTLEKTNEPYAIAKIAGIKLCESYNRQHNRDYRSVMPTNLYGPNDNFHPSNSHVIPALLRCFHEATQQNAADVVVWGAARRCEFLHVDDMAAASIHVMELDRSVWLKTPSRCCRTSTSAPAWTAPSVSWRRRWRKWWALRGGWCLTPPNRTARRASLLDVSRHQLGWYHGNLSLEAGLASTYQWF